MKHFTRILLCLLVLIPLAAKCYSRDIDDLKRQNEVLFQLIRDIHHPTDEQMEKIHAIFAGSVYMGQGNPSITVHPVTREQCEEKIKEQGIEYENPVFERICGARYMAPLYDPDKESPEDACVCIDQFEFPIGKSYIKEIEKVKTEGDARAQMEIFREFYNSFDFLQDDVEIIPIELSNNKAVYRYKNSEFFEDCDDYLYYYYIVCGLAEGLFMQYFNRKVNCRIINHKILENKEDSFVDISIEIIK